MPNRMYEAGRRKEYSIMKMLRAAGFSIVLRSAGSHSTYDVIAIDPIKMHIELIQCKAGKSKEREIKKLDLDSHSGTYTVKAYAI